MINPIEKQIGVSGSMMFRLGTGKPDVSPVVIAKLPLEAEFYPIWKIKGLAGECGRGYAGANSGLRAPHRFSRTERKFEMDLKGLREKAGEYTVAATDAAGKMVDEFNESLPTLRALGFTVKDLQMSMGLLPEISVKLVASTDTMEAKKIKEVMDKNPENKTLTAALKGLLAAYNLKQTVPGVPFKGIELDMKLGIPPRIGVGFVTAAPAEIEGQQK